jgi:hypothetical protein
MKYTWLSGQNTEAAGSSKTPISTSFHQYNENSQKKIESYEVHIKMCVNAITLYGSIMYTPLMMHYVPFLRWN